MDLTTLLPVITPRGSELPDDQRAQAEEVMDQIVDADDAAMRAALDRRDYAAIDRGEIEQGEIESWEARNVAVGAFRTQMGLLVGVREYTHTPKQMKEAEQLARKLIRESGIDISHHDLENVVGRGDDASVVAVYGGYATEEDAAQDARRALVSRLIEKGAHITSAGWRNDVVLMTGGDMYFLICRIHRDGTVDFDSAEHVLDARALYAGQLDELAVEMDHEWDMSDPAVPAGMQRLVSAWLRKEGAEALLDQARHNLTAELSMFRLRGSDAPMSVAELARSLHTDRPNLSRQLAKASAVLDGYKAARVAAGRSAELT